MTLATAPSGLLHGIEIALVIFLVVFILVALSVVLKKRGAFDDAARIPLDDDTPVTPRTKDTPPSPPAATEGTTQ